ncbi:MAG: hypothetical protein ACLQRH_18085 [Acidimicrobiales bacterium]
MDLPLDPHTNPIEYQARGTHDIGSDPVAGNDYYPQSRTAPVRPTAFVHQITLRNQTSITG